MLEIKETAHGFNLLFNSYRVLHHHKKQPLCIVGIGKGKYSFDHGMFKIKERLQAKFPLTNYEISEESKKKITVKLSSTNGGVTVKIVFKERDGLLEIVPTSENPDLNRFWFYLPATKGEAIYGCGEQFSEVNLRGKKVPLWCQEQGIGRGDPLWFTFLANVFRSAGGNHFTTYYPQPTFVSSENYFCHVATYSYALFNFKRKKNHELYIWELPEKILLGKNTTALETVGQLSSYLGRQPILPDWIFDGVILGIQGGSELVSEKLALCEEHGVKVAAVWCQDWEGQRITSFGKQLFWDWIYDPTLYPDFPHFIKQLNAKGIKFLGYINTFLALEGELYKEASAKDYLVKNQQGEEYHVEITTFPAAILDLTNPETVNWIKKIIKENMLGIGLDGWMADFGEYLPPDAVLHSGEDAAKYHNKFPVDWARINREVLEETNTLDEVVFFTRAGYSHTSKYSPLVWAGDQLVNWSIHDGLASVIPAGISLGICGIGNFHFDIGGYTAIGPFKRSKEAFMRWAEAAAFTMVMRSHEGNRPEDNWQFDTDEETLQHLAKMSTIHVSLKPYLQKLAEQYAKKGYPPIRACYLHYEDDERVHGLKYQYLLGQDLLIAPVIKRNKKSWKVYLPKDRWVHLWTGEEYTEGWVEVVAPIGEPPVFYRKNSQYQEIFATLTK